MLVISSLESRYRVVRAVFSVQGHTWAASWWCLDYSDHLMSVFSKIYLIQFSAAES